LKKLVLASASPRRESLLKMLGFSFSICITDIDETIPEELSPKEAVERLSLEKAKAAATGRSEEIIIAADTIVALDGIIFGKPADKNDAFQILKALSGREHSVFTGVTVYEPFSNKTLTRVCETKVKMRKLTDEQIIAYIATGEPMDKAGAYGIQGYAACFVEGINGCYFNVMGLPLAALSEMLEKFEVYITDNWEKLTIRQED